MAGNFPTSRYFTLILALIFIFNAIGLGLGLAQAGLPPRPTSPAARPASGSNSDVDNPIGGYIALQMPAAPAGLWTVVQWQGPTGEWHNVEGWQGRLEEGGQKVWWVQPTDFHKGPFRWAVYQGQNGPLLVTSPSFYLPGQGYEVVPLELLLAP